MSNDLSKSEFKRISAQRPNDCAGCLRGVPLTEDGRHHRFKGGCGEFRCTKQDYKGLWEREPIGSEEA